MATKRIVVTRDSEKTNNHKVVNTYTFVQQWVLMDRKLEIDDKEVEVGGSVGLITFMDIDKAAEALSNMGREDFEILDGLT